MTPPLNRNYAVRVGECLTPLFDALNVLIPVDRSIARLRYNSPRRGYRRRRVAVLEWLARQVAENNLHTTS